jgi:hypothetical protein
MQAAGIRFLGNDVWRQPEIFFSAPRIHFPLDRVFENFNDPASLVLFFFSKTYPYFLSDGEHDGVLGMRITHTHKIIYGLHANTLCDIKRE